MRAEERQLLVDVRKTMVAETEAGENHESSERYEEALFHRN